MENGLPKGWQMVTLGAVCEKPQYGFTTKSGSFGKIKYLRTTDISSGKIDWESVPFCVDEPDDVSKYQLRKNDIVVSRAGSVGISYLIDEVPENAVFASYLIRFNTKNIPAKFIAYFLQSKAYWNAISEMSAGIAVPNVNASKLSELPIPLPPLPEQHRIVARLDAVLAKVGNARERMERLPGILQRFRQSVLAQAVSGKLTEGWREENVGVESVDEMLAKIPIPKKPSRYNSRSKDMIPGDLGISVGNPDSEVPDKWKWVPLIRIAELATGHTPSKKFPEYWDGDIPWISLPDAREHHGKAIHETTSQTNQLGLDNSAACLLPAGTVCLSRTASVGYVTKMGRSMATSQDFVNWICTDAIDPDWLMYLLVAEKASILRFGKGTTHTTVYFPEVISFHVKLPPLPEQKEIVRRVQSLFAVADRLEERYEALKEKVEGLPQAVLGKAFRGELV